MFDKLISLVTAQQGLSCHENSSYRRSRIHRQPRGRAFLQAGHEVVVMDDLSSGRKENLPPGVRLEVMDVRDPQVADLMAREGFNVVDHHASQISVPASVNDPVNDAQINVLGLLNLLEAGRGNNVKRFIFSSSGGAIYGELERLPADENLTPVPLSPYAVAKSPANSICTIMPNNTVSQA